MTLFPDHWRLVYEVLSTDQDRAAQFARDMISGVKVEPERFAEFCAEAQKLFGRGYIVNLKTGMVRPVRMFDDAPGNGNETKL